MKHRSLLFGLLGIGVVAYGCQNGYPDPDTNDDPATQGGAGEPGTAGTKASAGVSSGEEGGAAGQSSGGAASLDGCHKDTDCKGNRICVDTACVDPPEASSAGATGMAGAGGAGGVSAEGTSVSMTLGTLPGLKSLELFAGFYDPESAHISSWRAECTATTDDLGGFQKTGNVYTCDAIPQAPLGLDLALNYHLVTDNIDAWGCYGTNPCTNQSCAFADYAPISFDGVPLSVTKNGVSNGQYGCNYVVKR